MKVVATIFIPTKSKTIGFIFEAPAPAPAPGVELAQNPRVDILAEICGIFLAHVTKYDGIDRKVAKGG